MLWSRRRLSGQLTRWRLLSVLMATLLVFSLILHSDIVSTRDHLAQLNIEGVIVADDSRSQLLEQLANNSECKALIITIDSPGGTAIGGEILYNDILRFAQKKPVVGVIRTVGTSAAYLVASATDHLIAGQTSLTGSIGVLLQTAQFDQLLKKLGISAEAIKSSPLKGAPSPLEPMTANVRTVTKSLIIDTHQWLMDIIKIRRQLSDNKLKNVSDGRLFTGRQALAIGLVDELGGMHEARQWLEKTHNLSLSLPLKNTETDDDSQNFLQQFLFSIKKIVLSERLTLDGLISLWQPHSIL